jgi:hypothetical protein
LLTVSRMHGFRPRSFLLLVGASLALLSSARVAIAQSAPGAEATPAATSTRPSTVWVHIEGAREAELQQDSSGDGHWQSVCAAPCDRELSADALYRIGGPGMRPSAPLRLSGVPSQHETITVAPASSGAFSWGIFVTFLGSIVVVGGVGAGVLFSTFQSCGSDPTGGNCTSGDGTPFFVVGAMGAAAVIGGILLMTGNASTTVSQGSQAPQNGAGPSDAWKPVATWRAASPEQRAFAPIVGVPLWNGRF